jgi:hypothetical protein
LTSGHRKDQALAVALVELEWHGLALSNLMNDDLLARPFLSAWGRCCSRRMGMFTPERQSLNAPTARGRGFMM